MCVVLMVEHLVISKRSCTAQRGDAKWHQDVAPCVGKGVSISALVF